MKKNQKLLILVSIIIFCSACSNSDKQFRLIPSSESGITFRNTLTKSSEFNILNYMYFYNGGGVACADFNGDKLPDIYFTSNQESNKLYLNKGGLKFQDITEIAGVEGFNGWTTGVTTADVNADGRLDIYVGYLGDYLIYKGKNQLFINEGNDENGIPKFTDRAMEYGLDLIGFSTQAGFFDYDRDGDLDMFMLNHSLHQQGTFGKSSRRKEIHPLAGDKLLKNENGHFIDVTQQAGIYSSVIGYGLGLAFSDVNMDGWLDIYVGNDFHENDYLYLNQQDGTFKEMLDSAMNHTSRFSMGVDFGDINNDAFPDLISTDMLPADPQILKASANEDPYDVYKFKIGFGYSHQFARNNLQLNNQDGTFSEIALQAGVSSTDWSWSALLADFDLDGYKDIFIANGIPRRPNDLDYSNFMAIDSIRHNVEMGIGNDEEYIAKMPRIKLANYLFQNNHDSTFSNKAVDWGLDEPSYSNGVAYADLDNDGDLDLVVNNLEDEAFLFENQTINKLKKDAVSHFIKFELKGKSQNQFGIGAKVFLYDDGVSQMQECIPTRGFQSAVDYALSFGVKGTDEIDSVRVIWNDGSFQNFRNVKTDQNFIIDQQNASGNFDYSIFHRQKVAFENTTKLINVPFKHRENSFVEFTREQLIPHMLSAEGPASAVGDVNGDGLEDIFMGGAKWQQSKIFIQTKTRTFKELPQSSIASDSTCEDVDALFFDADLDKDQDLLVVSGGNEFSGKSQYRKPRLYKNDGKGNFTKSEGIPDVFLTGSCVSINDVDNDGDLDLFLGARTTTWHYGIKPDSYMLVNDGKGNFSDATDIIAPQLKKFGFVKDAIWADIDNDKDNDLIIAAEWSPITIFINEKGKLSLMNLEGSGLEKTNGWWNVIKAFDYDHDGDLDLVAGNLGLNSKLHTSVAEPVKMFVSDFDNNDSTDQILTHYVQGKEYPFHTRDEMTKQMPYLKKRYLSYHKFAEATLHDMFTDEVLNKADQYVAYTFQTSIIENLGNGKFNVRPLPSAAQFSTVNAILTDDFDGDGKTDLLLAGNFYPINIQMGRYDASYGLFLKGNGKGKFDAIPAVKSGLSLKGEVRDLEKVKVGDKVYYFAIRNNDTIETFTLNK
jgi:hypothetical protein